MEFTIKRETFVSAVAKTMGVVERTAGMPILGNLLVMARDGEIEIAATDREIGITTAYDASVIDGGEFTLPARKLYETVRALEGETLHLKTAGAKDTLAVLTCHKTVCRLNGMPADEFPAIAGKDGCETSPVGPALLRSLIRKVSYAVSKDSSRQNITGIFLEKITEGSSVLIKVSATDGHRLAVAKAVIEETDADPAIPEKGVIIPLKGATEIRKIAEGAERLQVGFTTGSCIVEANRAVLRVNLIEGDFPDVRRAIPDQSADGNIRIGVLRDALLSSLRRMAVYCPECVILSAAGDLLRLETSDPDVGEIKDEIWIESPATREISVKFNVRYLIDAVEAATAEKVILNLPAGLYGCVIRGADDENYLAVVMPLTN